MPNPGNDHIFLKPEKFSDTKQYDYTGNVPKKQLIPPQNRANHTVELKEQVKIITKEMAAAIALQEESKSILDKGLIVEFESFEGIGDAFEENSFGRGIELLNTRYADKKTFATVFIPDGSLQKFENKIDDYFNEKKRKDGRSLDHQRLIDTISNFRKATVKALWTDTIPLPDDRDEILCWEVWLTARDNRQNQLNGFKALAKTLNIEASNNSFEFKERTVLLIRATTKQLEQSLHLLNNIAELRKAKTLADFFTEMKGQEQKEWLADLQNRIISPKDTGKTPFICVLDTGINAAHPLLEKFLGVNDLHTINKAWGEADIVGHGTEVAGLALYGDLIEAMETKEQLELVHRLESSKIINSSEYIPEDTKRPLDLYADFTKQGVAQVEISNADRNRIFQMAITTIDSRDRGKPSSWSAALDMLAVGMDNEGKRRLFVIAAGNLNPYEQKGKFPYCNIIEGIRDPGQAWNAITVGANTEKDLLSDDEKTDGSIPTASHGNISPYTTTSRIWDSKWPLKPDIVMEGGNTAENKQGRVQSDSLSLLTTNKKFQDKLFTTIWATSAASALASRMCVQIIDKYPYLRPETIRALVIHSASWTPAMLRQFDCDKPRNNKNDYINLVRICGFGVPSLTRAMSSMKNDFTMIIEDSLQPYKIEKNTRKNNEIKFYSLPFPQKELLELGETPVEMKVTLSYFIEPNPSSRGRTHHSYKSHGLRFDVKNPSELEAHFMGRLTKSMQEEGENYKNDTSDIWWTMGKNGRTKGSIHSDIWHGTAVELAECGSIAIYPVSGWWRNNQKDKTTINNIAHYSLLVSIKTSVDVDLMTPVELKIANIIKTDVEV